MFLLGKAKSEVVVLNITASADSEELKNVYINNNKSEPFNLI